MKRILITLCLAVAAVFAPAQEQLNIILKDSSYVTYSFSEKPKVTISGSTLNISTEQVTIHFAMSQVAHFQFGDEPGELTGVDEVQVVTNGSDSGALQVYTTDGTLVRSAEGAAANRLRYSDLPKGIYIVRKGNVSHKIVIR